MGSPVLKHIYQVSEDDYSSVIGNVSLLYSVGALLWSLISGPMCDKIGRFNIIVIGEILSFVSYYLMTIKNLHVLYAARFLSGLISCLNTGAGQLYFRELMPSRLSSTGGML